MTRQTIQRLIDKWTVRLRLQHWDIYFEVVSEDEMPGKIGQIQVTPSSLHAHISILDEEGRKAFTSIVEDNYAYNIEDTIVHELLHLWFNPLCPADAEPEKLCAMEQAIVRITSALTQTDRQAKSMKGSGLQKTND